MLISVRWSEWGLAMCTLSLSDGGLMLRLDSGDLDADEVDAGLRAEWAGYVLDEHTAHIRQDWLRRQRNRVPKSGADEVVRATIVSAHSGSPARA